MTGQTVEILFDLDDGSDTDVEELEVLTRQLREELLDLNVNGVDFVSGGSAPAAAKSGDPVTWGTLILTLAASGGVITTLINVLQTWLTHQHRHSVTLEIDGDRLELTSATSEEKQQLIDAWLARHKGSAANDG